MENVCTTKRLFIETWVEEMKPVVISDKRDEFESRKHFEKRFIMEYLYYQNSDATNKLNGFSAPCSPTSVFQTEFMMDEFELVVVEQKMFKNGTT